MLGYNNDDRKNSGYSSFGDSFSSLFMGNSDNKYVRYGSLILVVVVVALFFMSSDNSCVTASTIERTKIEAEITEKDYYNEADAGIVETWYSSESFEQGMQYFYEKTGVWPFVAYYRAADYPDKTPNEVAQFIYEQNITDKAHFVFVFNGNTTTHASGIYVGEEAAAVLDSEAQTIFKNNFDTYMGEGIEEKEILPFTYTAAADGIMKVAGDSNSVILVIVAAIAFIALYTWSRMSRKGKKAAAEDKNPAEDSGAAEEIEPETGIEPETEAETENQDDGRAETPEK